MNKILIALWVGLIFSGGGVELAEAYPITVDYAFGGINTDPGEISEAPKILIIVKVKKDDTGVSLEFSTENSTLFKPDIDFHFDFSDLMDPDIPGLLAIFVDANMGGMAVAEDTLLTEVSIENLDFIGVPSLTIIDVKDVVVLRTIDEVYFMLGDFIILDNSVSFEVFEISAEVIPEPSTLLLVGLGLLALAELGRRRNIIKCKIFRHPLNTSKSFKCGQSH